MTKQLSSNSSDISLSFKMLYLLGIIMIVDGHIGTSDYLDLNGLLRYQNYHVALFMFASGYFLKLERSYGEFFKRKFMHLLLPLYLWNIFYGILCWYLNHYHQFSIGNDLSLYNTLYAPLVDGHQYIYNMASWFIIPLFLIQSIIFMILKPFSDKDKSITSILLFLISITLSCLLLPYAPENQGARNLELTFFRTIYFLPAFSLGYCYRHLIEKHDTMNSPLYFIIVLGTISILETIFPNYNHVPSWLSEIHEPTLAIYSISLLSIMFWVRVSKILSPLVEKSKTLRYCADHTFDIMMHHFIGFMCIKYIFSKFSYLETPEIIARFKSDIWYYIYPISEERCTWFYITISIVIALSTGFTSRKFCAILKSKLNKN